MQVVVIRITKTTIAWIWVVFWDVNISEDVSEEKRTISVRIVNVKFVRIINFLVKQRKSPWLNLNFYLLQSETEMFQVRAMALWTCEWCHNGSASRIQCISPAYNCQSRRVKKRQTTSRRVAEGGNCERKNWINIKYFRSEKNFSLNWNANFSILSGYFHFNLRHFKLPK